MNIEKRKAVVDNLFKTKSYLVTRETYEKYKNIGDINNVGEITRQEQLDIIEIRTFERNIEAYELLA